jgi:4-hydroxythreonine-4-phosphate dehydrogenase
LKKFFLTGSAKEKMKYFSASLKAKQSFSWLAITCGDKNGVGYEIALKSLLKVSQKSLLPQTGFVLLTAGPQCSLEKKLRLRLMKAVGPGFVSLSEPVFFETFGSGKGLCLKSDSKNPVIEVISSKNPVEWVETAAKLCVEKKLDGMVTGPISKMTIRNSGRNDLGHNDILRRLTQTRKTYMSFYGSMLGVSLLTGHVPLDKVSKEVQLAIDRSELHQLIRWSHQIFNTLAKSHKPVGLLSLNPHAGDQGLIGKEELQWSPMLSSVKKKFLGPLPPDTAFVEAIRKKVCGFVCLYHDQGLIPFKLLHGFDEGCQISLGLPFWRTSVDHGPGYELFGKNEAKFGSMFEAIMTCKNLIKNLKPFVMKS